MKDVLEEIVAWKRIEVAEQKTAVTPRQLHAEVEQMMAKGIQRRSMRQSLADSPYGIIAEFKRKSPSKGWIHPDVEPEQVVPLYAQNGASALSILTDEKYFGGSMEFVKRIRKHPTLLELSCPILRKDFIIDEYQLFQARQIGADAVLLIAAALSKQACKTLTDKAHELGLEVLLEMHSESELDYADLEVDMIGINNRNLGTFHTDVENSFRLASQLPQDKLRVSESGISKPETIIRLRQAGFRGFLIGETFMKEANPGLALKNFIEEMNVWLPTTTDIVKNDTEKNALSEEFDENGIPFVKLSNGSTIFGEIEESSGLQAAPIRLSRGFQDANGKGYGLAHIEANHGAQIKNAGFKSVETFVAFVAQNYDRNNIRVGKQRNNKNATYLILVTNEHDNTLFIELSRNKSYWNVNSAGIFRKGYSNKKETVAKTEPQQPDNAFPIGSSLSTDAYNGITSEEPNGEPTVSNSKDNFK